MPDTTFTPDAGADYGDEQYAQYLADREGELYAEAVASWVTSGGNPADASRYAAVVSRGEVWDGGIGGRPEFSGETCDHGLALELCADPVNHYPPDDPADYY